jgi:hypothetical protein
MDFFEKNWDLISQNPLIFISFAFIVGATCFAIGKYLHREEISILKSRIDLRDDTIENYKKKLDGASPDEAKAKMDVLEAKIAEIQKHIAQRKLSENDLDKIASIISPFKGSVVVEKDVTCTEGSKISSQLVDIFNKSGWKVSNSMVMGVSNPPIEGLSISTSRQPSEPAKAVIEAFEKLKIPFSLRVGALTESPHREKEDVEILITTPVD